jgi:hypothetical protein
MRIVDRPVTRPQHCAAIPHRGQTAEGERWIDTGSELPGFDNHVYLSETAVLEAARLLGHPSQKQLDDAIAERDEALEELERALVELSTLKPMKALVERIKASK